MTILSTTKRFVFAVLASATLLALSAPALAGPVCPCETTKCILAKGREQKTFEYDPKNMAAYDALERAAMAEADDLASKAADNAEAPWIGQACPDPCDIIETHTEHGKPFAGGSRGHGIARSLWKVYYHCHKKIVPEPQPPRPANVVPGQPGGGGDGGGSVKPNIEIPAIPKCYGLPADEDDLLQELERLRQKVLLNFPLGANKGEPEYEAAKAQQDANLAAIDDAIKQAKATPLCKPHSSFWDHFSIGVGVGTDEGGNEHHHEDHPNNTPHD